MSRLVYVVIALITFVLCLALLAPASIVKNAVERVDGLTLSELSGTLWSGSGTLNVQGQPLGALTYRFKPLDLLLLRATYEAHLSSPTLDLNALASASLRAATVEASGHVDAAALRALLSDYDMDIGGAFDSDGVHVVRAWDAAVPNVDGELRWTGAPVTYRLGNVTHQVRLPALAGFIDSSAGAPEMTAYEVDHDTPLMLARVGADGWVTIGITKRFTQLLGQPWQGSDADHAVVLEVQEKLF